MIPEFQHFQQFGVIVILWLASEALADTLIAILLVVHLVSSSVVLVSALNADKCCIAETKDWI